MFDMRHSLSNSGLANFQLELVRICRTIIFLFKHIRPLKTQDTGLVSSYPTNYMITKSSCTYWVPITWHWANFKFQHDEMCHRSGIVLEKLYLRNSAAHYACTVVPILCCANHYLFKTQSLKKLELNWWRQLNLLDVYLTCCTQNDAQLRSTVV